MENMTRFQFTTLAVNSATDRCIFWPFAKDADGYGRLNRIGQTRAHRVVYTLAKGDIPDGFVVMHSCDNRDCVNPRHLSVGTHRDNVYDAVRKGRAAIRPGGQNVVDNKGEKHGLAKLTNALVIEIRQAAKSGWSAQKIAAEIGVARQTISDVVTGKTWRHV